MLCIVSRNDENHAMTSYPLITDTTMLATHCAAVADAEFITFDTEFLRDKTYFPKLCLVQIANPDGDVFLIDTLAPALNLTALWQLLTDAPCLKVVHSGRQDIELVYQHTGRLPNALFDTQIAASALGYGEQVGYDRLVDEILGITICKAQRFTDWSERPLSTKQLEYAAGDVLYLGKVYTALHTALHNAKRSHWVEEETTWLLQPSLYENHPSAAWKRLKFGKLKEARQLAVLQTLAEWREKRAQEKNIPRPRILKDDALLAVASLLPKDSNALKHARSLERVPQKIADEIITLIQHRLENPDSWPLVPKQKPPTDTDSGVIDLLSALLKTVATTLNVSPSLIAKRAELEALASGSKNLPCLTGWRREAFGERAQQLLDGKIHMGVDGNNVNITDTYSHLR